MSFNTRDFLKGGLLAAVGQAPDYKVILDAVTWHDKGYLEQSDLEEIQAAIDAKNAQPEVEETTPETEEPTEPVEA